MPAPSMNMQKIGIRKPSNFESARGGAGASLSARYVPPYQYMRANAMKSAPCEYPWIAPSSIPLGTAAATCASVASTKRCSILRSIVNAEMVRTDVTTSPTMRPASKERPPDAWPSVPPEMSASSIAIPEIMIGTHASATSTTAQCPTRNAIVNATMTVMIVTIVRPSVSPERAWIMFTSVASDAHSAPEAFSGRSCHPTSWRTSAL
mmetsp:Transcript_8451/g.20981  ORF Transcript_8451/g.20981 Transcript_8451/m.20981 type:complete len:207 (-) Transcript_8451:645-1265(-)